MSGLGSAGQELGDLLASTREQLEALKPRQAQLRAEGIDPRQDSAGADRDGLVSCKMGADGRLVELVLDDRTSVLPRAQLQRAIVEAVNAAWVAGRDADPAAAAAIAVDPQRLQEDLENLRGQAVRSMNQITEGLLDAMRQIHNSVRR